MAGGYGAAYLGIVKYSYHRSATGNGLADQGDDGVGIGRIQRRSGFVQQQQGPRLDHVAGDVDALLLPAGKGRRGQVPQPLRNAQAGQPAAGFLPRCSHSLRVVGCVL